MPELAVGRRGTPEAVELAACVDTLLSTLWYVGSAIGELASDMDLPFDSWIDSCGGRPGPAVLAPAAAAGLSSKRSNRLLQDQGRRERPGGRVTMGRNSTTSARAQQKRAKRAHRCSSAAHRPDSRASPAAQAYPRVVLRYCPTASAPSDSSAMRPPRLAATMPAISGVDSP